MTTEVMIKEAVRMLAAQKNHFGLQQQLSNHALASLFLGLNYTSIVLRHNDPNLVKVAE